MPWAFIYSRFGDETHTTLIFFAISGFYYLTARPRFLNRMLAALFLGLGVFTHLIFIIIPISYAAYFLIKDRFRLKMDKKDAVCLGVFLFFLFLRLVVIFKARFFNPQGDGLYYNISHAIDKRLIHKFLYSVFYFCDMLNGGVFYKRTTGDILLYVIPLNAVLFILSFIFLAYRHRFSPEYKDKDQMFLNVFILIYAIDVIFFTRLALRYFMVTFMFATMLIAIFLGTVKIRKPLRMGLVALMIFSNCAYIAYNYIYSFKKSGGRISRFWAGNYFEDTGCFIDSKILYDYLKEKNMKYAWVPEDLLRYKLVFLNLQEKRLHIEAGPEAISADKFYFVSHKGAGSPEARGLGAGCSIAKEATSLANYEIYLIQR